MIDEDEHEDEEEVWPLSSKCCAQGLPTHLSTVTLQGGFIFILQMKRGACRVDITWLESSRNSIGAALGCSPAYICCCPMPVSYGTERPQGRGLSCCWVLSRKCVRSKNSPSLETVNAKWLFPWGKLSTAQVKAVGEGQQAPGLGAVMPRQQEGSRQGPQDVECCLRAEWVVVTYE